MSEPTFKITFKSRPKPLFPGYRPLYKISLILIILRLNSNKGKASLLKLHMFSWALKSQENLNTLKNYVSSNFEDKITYFGIEPSLNRALNLAIGEKLIYLDKDKYTLTPKGDEFIDKVLSDDELFVFEKPILKFIGTKISEARINRLKQMWKNA